jgi:CRP-like cAMP-binding protein
MTGFDFVIKELSQAGTEVKLQRIQVNKGNSLIKQGQKLNSLYWIQSGLLREYYHDEVEEFTNSFLMNGSYYMTGFYFGGQIHSSFTVEALETSIIQILQMDLFNSHEIDHKVLLNVFKKLSSIKYHQNLDWKLINGTKNFLHRWELFKKKNPGVWHKIPQKHLASFFNITPQYLSKLKARRML